MRGDDRDEGRIDERGVVAERAARRRREQVGRDLDRRRDDDEGDLGAKVQVRGE